jgi:hypothetical protein
MAASSTSDATVPGYRRLYHEEDDSAYWTILPSPSDQRLKRDAATIPNAVETLRRLRGVTFHWNDDGIQHLTRHVQRKFRSASGKPEDDRKLWAQERESVAAKLSTRQVGFLAQDVEKVFPDWVTEGESGYKGIDMRHLNAVLVNAINEQQGQIDALRNEVAELRQVKAEPTATAQSERP